MNDKKQKRRSSVKTMLIAVMAALIAVPLLIALIVSSLNTMNEGIKTANQLNDFGEQIVEKDILSVVDQNMQVLKTLASSPSTIAYLSGDRSQAVSEEIFFQMQEIDANLNDGNSTIVTGADGKQLLRTVGNLVDIADREYFKQAISGNAYVSDIQVSKSTGERIATFAVPIYDASRTKVIGIAQRNYNLDDFHEILANAVVAKRQEIVIVDRLGSVIAHSGHEIAPDAPEDQSMNPFYTESRGTVTSGSYESTWQGETWMISWIKENQTGWVVANCQVRSVALSGAVKTTVAMIVIGIVSLAVGIVVAIFVSRYFTNPLKVINESLGALSDGRFVKVSRYTGRNDEFGEIIKETNTVIDSLSEIVADIKKSAVQVNEESVELAETADQISQTADDVSNAVQEIAHGATQQADEVQQANNNTMNISDNIQLVSDNAESVAKTASEMNDNSRDSAEKLDKLKESSENMSRAIDEISEKIAATGAAVERISGKVEAINSIASQTNLLALNASIEAARAGEAGRGFAVVAEEIGKLADESSHSADEIRTEMNLLLSESQSAVATAKEVNESTREQKEILVATVESISKLIEEIESSVAGISSITTSAEACEASKSVIIDAMSSLSSISEENAASCEETSASMEELNATVNTLASAADALRHISDGLIKKMRFFKD